MLRLRSLMASKIPSRKALHCQWTCGPKFEPKPNWLCPSWPLASKVRQAGPSGHLNQRSYGQWQQKGTEHAQLSGSWITLVRSGQVPFKSSAPASFNHLGPQNILLACLPWKMVRILTVLMFFLHQKKSLHLGHHPRTTSMDGISHIQWFQPFAPRGASLSSSKGFRGDGSCFRACRSCGIILAREWAERVGCEEWMISMVFNMF